MKKIFLALILLILAAAAAGAQLGPGAKAVGMGSAFVALANDSTAAYYNPAGIVNCGSDLKLSLGAALNNLDKMSAAFSNPTKFLSDNFSNSVIFNGNLNSLLGFAVNGIGLSAVIPGSLQMNKPANSIQPSGTGSVTEDITITLGHSFGLPGLDYLSSIDVGINAKYILGQRYVLGASGATDFNETLAAASGMAFDIGAQANITDLLRAGIAVRDISGNVRWTGTTNTKTINPVTGAITATGASANYSLDTARDVTTALGLAAKVPGTGLLTALEIDSAAGTSTTHIGFEYPLLPGFLTLRGGYITGSNTAIWTSGLGLDLVIFSLNAAYGSNTSTNSSFAVVDLISVGF